MSSYQRNMLRISSVKTYLKFLLTEKLDEK